VIKVLNPMDKISEEKKNLITKVEEILDGIYKADIDTEDYIPFMEKYNENIEAKIESDENFKFEYKERDTN
jgi:RNA recognition motif-containing protein